MPNFAGALRRVPARSALLALCAFAGGALTGHWASAESGAVSPYDPLKQMARVMVLIENQYVEPVERQRLTDGAIKGMVAELDPHSAYLPPRDYSMFAEDTEGKFGGIGVEVDFREEGITVIAPIEDSPAERAGVRSGDRIVAIDDRPVRGQKSEDLIRRMRGKPGTSVKITVRRQGKEELLSFTLKREIIRVKSVGGKLLARKVAYIRLKQFQSGTHRELVDVVRDLRREAGGTFAGIVLDMRYNPGGLVDEAGAVADEFLSGGVIYSTRRRGRTVDEARATSGGVLSRGPLVVLVNEYSASAAELVAGALQDHRRGKVIGARTFGKGSVQSILELPGGAGMRLTSMRYYTPNGRVIQAKGIEPDVVVESSRMRHNYSVLREEDLEGHLPAEGPPGSGPSPDAGAPAPSEADAGSDEPSVPRADRVPADPTGADDFALSIGYQIVLGIMNPRAR